jgi:hypothetical protein
MLRVVARRPARLSSAVLPAKLPRRVLCKHEILRRINYAAGIGASEEAGIDDAPVLRVVCQRSAERARLLSEVSISFGKCLITRELTRMYALAER